MRNFTNPLLSFIILLLAFQSCKKDLSSIDEAERKDTPEFLATNSMHGSFEQVSEPYATYRSQTSIISFENFFGGDPVPAITDATLTATFSQGVSKVDPDPVNWNSTPWGTLPQVESLVPHALYNDPNSFPQELTLSRPVKTFGLEIFWNGNSFSVEYYSGTTLLGVVTKEFSRGIDLFGAARLFAATTTNNSIDRIVLKPGGDIEFGIAMAQFRYAIAPPPPPPPSVVSVDFDVQPGSCENNFNTRSQGVTPMVIYGSSNLSVSDIDLATLKINGVSPLRSSFERIGSPYAKQNDCDCSTSAPDLRMDLALKFDTQALVPALAGVADGARATLVITGKLKNGMNIQGRDCVRVKRK
jgi:hypothetical protein